MTDRIKQHLQNLIKKNFTTEAALLLGLSGGNDSLALFYLLIECQKEIPFKLGIAHIDHGWRPESASEAADLKELASKHHLSFHLKRLDHEPNSKNIEAKCREQRIAFFEELCIREGYQSVLLAHHLDDQAETVLKNIFEGANLCSCNGIAEHTTIRNLHLWRPLLQISKKELTDWVDERNHKPFIDETNFDTKFLRARMREKVIPQLEILFGKRITSCLASHGSESQELKEFMTHHLKEIVNTIESGPMGSYIDLSPHKHLGLFEIKFIVRQICQQEHCLPSRDIVEGVAQHLHCQASNKQFIMGKHHLFVDRMRLFIVKDSRINASFEQWNVEIEEGPHEQNNRLMDWRAIWQGSGEVILPQTETPYHIGPPKMNSCYPRTSPISKWWNMHKVPAFLRQITPVIWQENKIIHEFLTGKGTADQEKTGSLIKLSVILNDIG